jgi:pyroglutamyl-peptidase
MTYLPKAAGLFVHRLYLNPTPLQAALHNAGIIRSAPSATPPVPCVLLTGFDAFGGASLNPSWLAAKALDGELLVGHTIRAAQLPTAFDLSLKELKHLLRVHKPPLVICVGQAGGRGAMSLERVAININDASIADNAGAQPLTPVVRGGPAAYFSTLPIKAMLMALQRADIEAEVSQSAGTFVCNHVFYGLMHELSKTSKSAGKPLARGGFVHVPFLPGQGVPSMHLNKMVAGLRLAVETALLALGGQINAPQKTRPSNHRWPSAEPTGCDPECCRPSDSRGSPAGCRNKPGRYRWTVQPP